MERNTVDLEIGKSFRSRNDLMSNFYTNLFKQGRNASGTLIYVFRPGISSSLIRETFLLLLLGMIFFSVWNFLFTDFEISSYSISVERKLDQLLLYSAFHGIDVLPSKPHQRLTEVGCSDDTLHVNSVLL